MVYKVDRVGTPHFYDNESVVAPFTLVGSWLNDRDALTTDLGNNVILAVQSAFTQFGGVKGYSSGSADWDSDRKLAFGQAFQAPQVSNGNTVAWELTAFFQGAVPGQVIFSHKVGKVSTFGVNPFDTALVANQPVIMETRTPYQDDPTLFVQTVAFRNRITIRDEDVEKNVYAHFIELMDSVPAGAGFTGLSGFSYALFVRGIDHADEMQVYDPVR